jgi:2-oxo-hept-3-ene-1,7-dioate hydratase
MQRPTLDHPEMTVDDAYRCQMAWLGMQLADGATMIGHKVGLTSRAMQLAMRIEEPDFGVLLDWMRIDNGATLRTSDYLDPKLEVEIAFVLAADLTGENVTSADVLAATRVLYPALELIDARSHRVDPSDGVSRGVVDTISDNAANAGIVVGSQPFLSSDVDLPWVAAVLRRNGVVEETGVAAGVLGDPAEGVAWLARRLNGFGIPLRAGEIILSGSFTRPVDCRAGDEFAVDFGALGSIEVTFA